MKGGRGTTRFHVAVSGARRRVVLHARPTRPPRQVEDLALAGRRLARPRDHLLRRGPRRRDQHPRADRRGDQDSRCARANAFSIPFGLSKRMYAFDVVGLGAAVRLLVRGALPGRGGRRGLAGDLGGLRDRRRGHDGARGSRPEPALQRQHAGRLPAQLLPLLLGRAGSPTTPEERRRAVLRPPAAAAARRPCRPCTPSRSRGARSCSPLGGRGPGGALCVGNGVARAAPRHRAVDRPGSRWSGSGDGDDRRARLVHGQRLPEGTDHAGPRGNYNAGFSLGLPGASKIHLGVPKKK